MSQHKAIYTGLYLERPQLGWFGLKMKNGFATTAAGAGAAVAICGLSGSWLMFKQLTAGSTACGGATYSKLAARKVIGFVADPTGIAGGATGSIGMCGGCVGIGPAAYNDGDFVGLSTTNAGYSAVRNSGFGEGKIFGYVQHAKTGFTLTPVTCFFPYRI